jgi:hypothetical protein
MKNQAFLYNNVLYPQSKLAVTEVPQTNDSFVQDRLPFEYLNTLFNSLPSADREDYGDFSGIVSQVKYLYRAAKTWQSDVSSIMNAPPRRLTSRRVSKAISQVRNSEEYSSDDIDVSPKIDLRKITELLQSPILLKVRNNNSSICF